MYENSSAYFAQPASGTNAWVYNTTNLTSTLNANAVPLNSFTALSSQSQKLRDLWSFTEFDGNTGKYYAGAIKLR